jgi:TRAP-type C4-dicarboxylate transport system permease small subunit
MDRKNGVVALARGVEIAIERGCNFLLLASGLGLLTLLTIVVVLRYAFEGGFGFAPDLSELLFCIFVMAGIAQAARMGAHVATQLLLHTLQGKARLALTLLIHAVTAFTFLALAWFALKNAVLAHDQTTPVLQIPWSVGYGCLSIGLALVALCSMAAIVRFTLGGEEVRVNLADAGPGVV